MQRRTCQRLGSDPIVFLVLGLLLASRAAAQNTVPWTPDDLLLAESASEMQLAPDNRAALWVKSSVDRETQTRISQVMLTRFLGPQQSQEVALTRGRAGAFSPRFSPDGRQVAFLTPRTDPATEKPTTGQQLWLLNLETGGEAIPLTEGKRSVGTFAWAGAETLYFTMQEEPGNYETQKTEGKDTAIVVEDEAHEPPVRLFQLQLPGRKITRLTDNADRISAISVSPDGQKVVVVHDRSLRFAYDQEIKPAIYIYDFQSGQRRRVFDDQKFNIGNIQWALNGQGFYAINEFSNGSKYNFATVSQLYYYDLSTNGASLVDLNWPSGLHFGSFSVTKDGFVALLADGVRRKAARYLRVQGGSGKPLWMRDDLSGGHVDQVSAIVTNPGDERTVLYLRSGAEQPNQWWRATLSGSKLTDTAIVADVTATRFQNKTQLYVEFPRWKGANNEDIEGVLYYPQGYQPGKLYPLVVMIHGGPFSADTDAWSEDFYTPAALFTQRGAFVLKPNYHGSANYGLPFAESIRDGKYYELPLIDIERGVDALIGSKLVDKDKLGVMGWSNGAILTLALIAQNPRYKAASSGAGGAEWTADWAACAFGHAFDRYYFGKTPLEDPALYRRMSPFYNFEKVRTPLLLFHGTEDTAVPTFHSWMAYRALQQFGKVDTRLVLFPGEGHGPRKMAHQRRKLTEELAWFDRYLFGTAVAARTESLRPGSPLAALLRARGVRKDSRSRYGVIAPTGAHVLIPEVVRRGGLEVGRFEVTRAQYAVFEPNYPVPTGTENYPASGITAERARAYCAWLSQQGVGAFRLPTEREIEPLRGDPSTEENTLDWWAGYALNPDDAAQLLKQVKALENGLIPPLLKTVGSFPANAAEGEEPIYDLQGNVAEWVTDAGGAAQVRGGSADTSIDARVRTRTPAPEYTGFRVVRTPGSGGALPLVDPPSDPQPTKNPPSQIIRDVPPSQEAPEPKPVKPAENPRVVRATVSPTPPPRSRPRPTQVVRNDPPEPEPVKTPTVPQEPAVLAVGEGTPPPRVALLERLVALLSPPSLGEGGPVIVVPAIPLPPAMLALPEGDELRIPEPAASTAPKTVTGPAGTKIEPTKPTRKTNRRKRPVRRRGFVRRR